MARRTKGKPKAAPAAEVPAARALPARREIEARQRRIGRGEVIGGGVCLAGAVVWALALSDASPAGIATSLGVLALGLLGAFAIAIGAMHLDPRPDTAVRADKRRWIYGGLASAFGVFYALCMWKVMPNRLASGMLHLTSVPVFTLVMAAGTVIGRRAGWWIAVVGGSLVLLSTIALIARILASAAFLAGVYGAFGKGAATFALVSVAIIVEVVALLPICQVKFLMSRAGRRTYGV